MKSLILLCIKLYQRFISPFKPRTCRFYPTCSNYTYQVIEKFGLLKGAYYGIKRISHCHPFNKGGYDPIPEE